MSSSALIESREHTRSDAASNSESPLPSFVDLGVPEVLVRTLSKYGINQPFPIQAATLPDALAGRNVLGRGQTGSGKTLAFGLPLLAHLQGRKSTPKQPAAVVMVPTRELAIQVNEALEPLASALRLRTQVVVGGMSMGRQIDALRRGVDIVIATPGRLTDLVERRVCDLSKIQIVVLDEADHMADMGFLPVVSALLDDMPKTSQKLLFSATLDRDVDQLVKRYLVSPVTHSTSALTATVSTMHHHLLLVAPGDKNLVTSQIANREGRTLLFVRTKHGADRLSKQLAAVGVKAGALHGGKTQSARNKTLAAFRDGKINALVATDVAARGIHVDGIDLVLHVDPAADHKDYLHRAGRTARAGESGTVVTLVLPPQRREVEKMAQRAGVKARMARTLPGHTDLVRVTGAREPSGRPVREVVSETPRPANRGHSTASRKRKQGAAARPSKNGHRKGSPRSPGKPRIKKPSRRPVSS
ncbi:MAG: DEAD/DEAH box helicase [Candidatus Nanopelagicales bacterium]